MDLNNEFRVGVPPAVAWSVLTDVERIAPCMPGAQLQEIEGDEFRGVVKVKVGPITAQYKGKATFLERDESGGRLVLRAEGRDTRGQGNANATITATLSPAGDGTSVKVVTDLTVTGKVAQFGRGVLAEVSAKLLNQFVSCLETDVLAAGNSAGDASAASPAEGPGASVSGAGGAASPGSGSPGSGSPGSASPGSGSPGGGAAGGASATTATSAGAGTVAAGTTGSRPASVTNQGLEGGPNGSSPEVGDKPTVRKIESREAAPVDLLNAAGGSVIKRAAPVVAIIAVLLALLGLRRRRARRRGR